jgi:hypothetical protein
MSADIIKFVTWRTGPLRCIMQIDASKSIKKGPSAYTKSQFITVLTKA